MTKADELYANLEKYIQEVERAFVADLLSSSELPEEVKGDDLPIRAYCVLCHAGFEEYLEEIARLILNHSLERWENNKSGNFCLLSILAYYPRKNEDRSRESRSRMNSHLEKRLEIVRTNFNKDIKANHGIKDKNLRKILEPIGLEWNSNPIWIGSLNGLANYRGEVAHRGFPTVIKSVKAVKDWITDCRDFCSSIRDQANSVLDS